MAPMDATFNAQQHEPRQVSGKHPPGNKFPFTITGTDIKDVKDGGGKKYFEVIFTSPAGSIRNNYNLWNDSKQAVDISVGQLSALCHATGIIQIDFKNDGAALRGGKGLMDVGFQAGQEPSADKPEGGYVEIKKIYDVSGNEPGKGPAPSQQTSGFGQQQQTTEKPAVQHNWGGNAASQDKPTGSWQQGATSEKPPWS